MNYKYSYIHSNWYIYTSAFSPSLSPPPNPKNGLILRFFFFININFSQQNAINVHNWYCIICTHACMIYIALYLVMLLCCLSGNLAVLLSDCLAIWLYGCMALTVWLGLLPSKSKLVASWLGLQPSQPKLDVRNLNWMEVLLPMFSELMCDSQWVRDIDSSWPGLRAWQQKLYGVSITWIWLWCTF